MSARAGKALEGFLEHYHAFLRRRGEAQVFHVPTPVQITGRRGGKVTGRTEAVVWCDYAGLLRGGLGVAFEAKWRKVPAGGKTARIFRSDLAPHQREALATTHDLGGVAFVYARFGSGEDLVVPWCVLAVEASALATDERWRVPAHANGWFDATSDWASYCQGGWTALNNDSRPQP